MFICVVIKLSLSSSFSFHRSANLSQCVRCDIAINTQDTFLIGSLFLKFDAMASPQGMGMRIYITSSKIPGKIVYFFGRIRCWQGIKNAKKK